jgi:hypothetical protein
MIKTKNKGLKACLKILLIGLLALPFVSSLKAQPAPGLQGIFIENQRAVPQDANFWISGHGIFGQTADNLIYLDPTAAASDQNSIYVNNSSGLGNFIKFNLNGQEKFEIDKEGAIWLNNTKMIWCNGACPTWTP